MSDQLTPEQAQRLTKEAWKARAENRGTPISQGGNCGWCKFTPFDACTCCPIHRIARMPCWRITEYLQWESAREPAERKAAASAVLELFEKYEDQLIAMGHRILKEWKR